MTVYFKGDKVECVNALTCRELVEGCVYTVSDVTYNRDQQLLSLDGMGTAYYYCSTRFEKAKRPLSKEFSEVNWDKVPTYSGNGISVDEWLARGGSDTDEDAEEEDAPIKSDGGSSSYYYLPEDAEELNDLIEHKGMGFALGNVFKACYRIGEKAGTDLEYDLNKMLYFIEERLLPYVRKHGKLP